MLLHLAAGDMRGTNSNYRTSTRNYTEDDVPDSPQLHSACLKPMHEQLRFFTDSGPVASHRLCIWHICTMTNGRCNLQGMNHAQLFRLEKPKPEYQQRSTLPVKCRIPRSPYNAINLIITQNFTLVGIVYFLANSGDDVKIAGISEFPGRRASLWSTTYLSLTINISHCRSTSAIINWAH